MYLKRILKPLPDIFVEKALEKHSLTLSTPSSCPSDELLSFTEWFIDTNVNLNCRKSDLDRIHSLSSSASFNTSRKDGGVQGEISLNLPCTKGKMSLRKFAIINNAMKTQIQQTNKVADINTGNFIKGNARPATVLEPLKVRIVTCEDSSNFRMKNIQKILWRQLLRGEEFCLTRGEDIFPPLIKNLLPLKELPLWISGDYTAATDNLNRNVINNVLTQLSMFLPPHLRNPFIKNGGSHFIKYDGEKVVEQVNGQLMGSLTSFPLLCYINFIAYNYCRSKQPGEFSPFVLINGDDILFRTTEKGYSIWKDTVKEFGLSPSLGKNYSSKNFFMINSRLFCVRGDKIEEEPFINWALLNTHPIKTEVGKMDQSNPFSPPFGQLLRTLFQQAKTSFRNERKLYGLFLTVHKKKLKRSINDLLIPSCLGGMGGLTIEEFRKTKLLNRSQREKMVNGFRFRLGLYALRNNLIPAVRSHVMRQNTIMGEAVNPYQRGLDPENPDPPTFSDALSFINKGENPSFPSIKTWLRRVIGKSSFIKSRIPDGVPNLL